MTLLRSYRADDWPRWFAAAGIEPLPARGPVFDSSIAMVAHAERSGAVALAPPAMFAHELAARRLVQPFPATVDAGRYYLTRLKSRRAGPALAAFAAWCDEGAS